MALGICKGSLVSRKNYWKSTNDMQGFLSSAFPLSSAGCWNGKHYTRGLLEPTVDVGSRKEVKMNYCRLNHARHVGPRHPKMTGQLTDRPATSCTLLPSFSLAVGDESFCQKRRRRRRSQICLTFYGGILRLPASKVGRCRSECDAGLRARLRERAARFPT